jgi:hypothetical protein
MEGNTGGRVEETAGGRLVEASIDEQSKAR